MIQAVFCDFFGTLVHYRGPILEKVVKKIHKSSKAVTQEEVLEYWWDKFLLQRNNTCPSTYQTHYNMALRCLDDTVSFYDSSEDPQELCNLMTEHWCNPIVYEDAQEFINKIDIPVYIVTNGDNCFIKKAVVKCGLHPDDVITSEQAKTCKPDHQMYQYALAATGLKACEVVHIGRSLQDDVEVPEQIGIRSIWLNRKSAAVPEGVTAATSLYEAKRIIDSMN